MGKALVLFDAAGNVSNGVQSGYDAFQNGFSLQNVLGLAGSVLGLAGNATAWKNLACFAAGTPILTPDGSTPIEDLRVGDWVLSRPEDDPEGVPVPRRVVELIRNYVPLLNLRIGGRVIRTSAEHPFWVQGRGWMDAHQMVAGDNLLGHEDEERWLVLEGVEGGQETAPVYNVQVEEYHTYFVGSGAWGFSVWAHNATCTPRYNGPKPTYSVNAAHVPGTLRSGKTPLPADAQEVFRRAVPDDAVNPRNWFGKNANGQTYRFSGGNDGTAHFSGIDGVGDGIRNLTRYARQRLEAM